MNLTTTTSKIHKTVPELGKIIRTNKEMEKEKDNKKENKGYLIDSKLSCQMSCQKMSCLQWYYMVLEHT